LFDLGDGVLADPDPDERWVDLGSQVMMEVKAIEVCRSWRSCRIAPAMLRRLMEKPQIEEKIIYMVGYSWTWDLKGTRKTALQYQLTAISERMFSVYILHYSSLSRV